MICRWGTRKADGAIPSDSKGLKAKRIDGINPSLETGEMSYPKTSCEVGKKGERWVNSLFLCLLFNLGSQKTGRCPPMLGRAICSESAV